MPSQHDLRQVRSALSKLSADASAGFQRTWDSLGAADRAVMSGALRDGWLAFLDHYGDLAASVGAEMFERWADELKIVKPRLVMAPSVDERRATARLGWALSQPDQLGNAMVLLDELVKQPYRSTMQDSAIASGAGWARVPTGSETCAFCLMLASRGGVYHSKQTAGEGKKYHGDCDCTPTLVRGPEDYPKGYDPDGLYDQYDAARKAAESGDHKAILSEMRRQST